MAAFGKILATLRDLNKTEPPSPHSKDALVRVSTTDLLCNLSSTTAAAGYRNNGTAYYPTITPVIAG